MSEEQTRHGAAALEEVRLRWGLLAAACVSGGLRGKPDWAGWARLLPNIPCEEREQGESGAGGATD